MSYAYDIVLNFNRVYYEFFEWKEEDEIVNFKKIGLFKVDDDRYLDLKFSDGEVSQGFLKDVEDNCYVNGNNLEELACLVSNGKEVMGLLFTRDGMLIGRSSLIFDEEEEVLDDMINMREYVIDYKIIKKGDNNILARVIEDRKRYVIDFLNENKSIDIYKYIYYDLYEEEKEDIKAIKDSFIDIIKNSWDKEGDKLYQCIKNILGVKQ